jgi:hypothetical protein
MANITLRSIVPAVNVRVAILALGGHVGEHRIHVALLARHIRMHSAKRITGFAVIELWMAP